MKKLVSIILLLCLPLLMHASWAMGMQMTLDDQLQATSIAAMDEMPCHEPAPTNADCSDCVSHDASHQSVNCGLCIISLSALRLDLPAPDLLLSTSARLVLPDIAFFSQDYPPSIKPPIHA
jgi:hypothetical protein